MNPNNRGPSNRKRDEESRADLAERNLPASLPAGQGVPPQAPGGDEGQDESGKTAAPQDATGVSSGDQPPSKNDIGAGEDYEEHAHHQKADRSDTSDE